MGDVTLLLVICVSVVEEYGSFFEFTTPRRTVQIEIFLLSFGTIGFLLGNKERKAGTSGVRYYHFLRRPVTKTFPPLGVISRTARATIASVTRFAVTVNSKGKKGRGSAISDVEVQQF